MRGLAGAASTEFLFAGEQAEAYAGLMYLRARYYDPALGRFASRDTVVPGLDNSQGLNRFAYALNNPLRYLDPSGHLPRMDPVWGERFKDQHRGRAPSSQDWWDYLFMKEYAPDLEWTPELWQRTCGMRHLFWDTGMEFTGGRWQQHEILGLLNVVVDFVKAFGSRAMVKERLGAVLEFAPEGACDFGNARWVPGCATEDRDSGQRRIKMTNVAREVDPRIPEAARFVDTVVHESGHILDYSLQAAGVRGLLAGSAAFQLVTLGEAGPTEYSNTNPLEKFAESFMVYMGYGLNTISNNEPRDRANRFFCNLGIAMP